MPIADLLKSLYHEDEEEKKPNLLETVVEHAFPIKKAVGLVKGVGESLYNQMDYMMSLSQMQMTNATLDGQRNLTLKERVQVNQELALETSKFVLYYGGPAGKAISGTIKNVAKGVSPIARRGWQKFLRRVFGEKWNKQQLDVLWNKINSPAAKFTDAEVSAIAEMKKISQTTGTSMGKLFAKEKLWLETKSGIYTDIRYGAKGLQFRPKPPISDKTYELKKIVAKPKPTISEKAVAKPEPTIPPKPKPLTPEEIEIIRHPPGRIVKEPPTFPETPTPVPPAPGIEKVITPYVPKKPIIKPTPLVPEELVTEYAGTAFGERATPPIIGGVGLGEKSPLDVYYPGIGPPSGQLPAEVPELPERVITDVKVAQGKILPRPKKINRFDVIKETTEDKIQTLRQRYTTTGQMTDEAYNKILEKEGLYNALTKQYKEPKYIDNKNYITEDKGRAILRRIHREAPVIKITESFNKAVRAKPDISKEVFNIDKRIKGGVKPGKQHRDPYSLESMRYYVQQAGRVMGNEAYAVYQDLVNSKAELAMQHQVLRDKLKASTPDFNKIANNDKALQRVSEYIASQSNLKGKPSMPKDITKGEIALAKELQRQFKDKQLQVRLAKFMQWYFTESRRVIPDFSEYADEIELARDIYDWRGYDELVKYLKTQEWGVVKSGYEPLESVVGPQVRVFTPAATAAASGHIQQRLDIRYHKSERNILQRYNSYMKQLDYLSVMQPKIKSLMNMFNDNTAKFKNPRKVRDDMTMFLAELKGYGGQPGFIDKALSRLYSQAMKTIIMPSPVLSFRNVMGQNISFAPDKSILFDPRNKKLTPDEMKYVETYVLQTKQMIDDYFLGKQKPLPGLGTLTKMLDKIRLYPLSDMANRYWGFWAKINQLKRVWGQDISLSAKMRKTKFEDMTYPEQKMALQILAKDGQEEMFKYIARVYTDNIHFIYERAQRSPAEMGALGKVVGNLLLFPRAYWERMTKAGAMLSGKGRSYKTRYRGLKIIFATILGGEAMGEVYKRATGRKRNPYSPLQLLQFRPGGLAWATIEEIATVWSDCVNALGGNRNALGYLTISIPKLPTMFVPFYSYAIRGLEGLVGMKNIDRYALRKLRMLIDKEYKVRGGHYKVNRTAIEKWQYFFSGRGIRIEEEEKPKKKGKNISDKLKELYK